MRIVAILLVTLTMISCSDFFNSKKSDTPVEATTIQKTNQPFPPNYDPNAGSFSEDKMIANIGLNVIAPATQKLRLQTELLNLELRKLSRMDPASTEYADQKEKTKSKWKDAMLTYHYLDAAPIGPMSDKQLKLSEQLYSWPYANFCGVDNEVVKLIQNPSMPVPTLFTLKGLAVLEYLLFEPNLSTQCNPSNARNAAVVQWTEKNKSEKEKDRMQYAYLISRDLVDQSRELESLWDPQTNNYTYTLVSGGRYSIKESVTMLSDSLFSVELIKDAKLAKPLGLNKECTSAEKKCADKAEHAWSGLAFEAMESQVQGFQAVFFGETAEVKGFGFDDDLISMGRPEVAQHIGEYINQFLTQLKDVAAAGTLQKQIGEMNPQECAASTIADSKVPVCSLYQSLRLLTTKMKTEFLVALSLRAPPTHQGDND